MAKWLAKEFDWDTGRYTGRYYDIAEPGVVAVFVDSFYGDDTAAGTAAAPFKTLGKAITTLNSTGANGSRIFMNGIFIESLPTQTYWYQFIGCGGGKNGRTIFFKNQATEERVMFQKIDSKFENIETMGYNYSTLTYLVNQTGGVSRYVVNSIIKNCAIQSGYRTYLRIYNCIFIDNVWGYDPQYPNMRIIANKSILINIDFGGIHSYFAAYDSYIKNCTIAPNPNVSNMFELSAQFIDEGNNNYNVYITSPLLFAGSIDEITGIQNNIGGVNFGLPYNGLIAEFSETGGATITDLTIDPTGKYTITAPATSGTLETALMDLGNIYPLENIDLFNVFDFLSGEITQGVFETFSSPRMALTIKLKYGLTSAEVDDCPWLLIEYGKQPTFSGTGASRVGNAADTFDPDTFQTITCRYMKLFVTLQNNS